MIPYLKNFFNQHSSHIIIFLLVALLSLASFGAGYILGRTTQKSEIKFQKYHYQDNGYYFRKKKVNATNRYGTFCEFLASEALLHECKLG